MQEDSGNMHKTNTRAVSPTFNARNANAYDDHVAKRIRMARKARGMSQTEFGDPLGISFQQIQKYESGKNRVSAGRLFEMANLLEVDISYFFEGLEPISRSKKPLPVVLSNAEELYAKFCSIKSPGVRKHVLRLVSVMSQAEEEE
jgi:transcriptional regulator with XRE-family HTH domain